MTIHPSEFFHSDFLPIIALGIFVPFAIYSYFWQKNKERSHLLQEVGISLGFLFQETDSQLLKSVPKFHQLTLGRSRRARNVFRGEVQKHAVTIFDYHFVTGRGRHARTCKQTIAIISGTKAKTEFSMRPETIIHRLTSTFGYQDIDFTSHPEFSQAYLLRGPNEHAIRQLFQPHVLSFFEIFREWVVEVKEGSVLCCRDQTLVEPDELRNFVLDIEKVVAVVS